MPVLLPFSLPRRTPAWLALAAAALLPGCASYQPKATHHRAFIQYWPEEAQKGRLRLAVKDNIDMKGLVTTAGSEFLFKRAQPATRDASCLRLARSRSDVAIVGKTNLSEFAVSPSGMNEYFGTALNPFDRWRHRLLPGGSSSGSAVAVAGGWADVAFGTDTAGSVRVPAAFCGVVGLKTTKGLVPIDGVYPIEAQHLDTVGPIARDIEHTVVGMDLLQSGFAARYREARAAHPTAARIKIGRLRLKGTDRHIDEAVDDALRRAGFQVVELSPTFTKQFLDAKSDGNILAAAGAWISDHAYGLKPEISGRTKTAILAGRLAYGTTYQAAVARRPAWQAALKHVFQRVDFIALPTVQTFPPPKPFNLHLGIIEAFMLTEQNTVAVNYAGNPALAVPIPLLADKDVPVPVTSLQLIGPDRSEAALLNAGRLVEAKVSAPVPPQAVHHASSR